MDFFTVVLRQSAGNWVALCLENGLVGQGQDQNQAISKLKEAVESWQMACEIEADVYNAPVSIEALHEFLAVEVKEPASEVYELRAVYA
jgi:hypothetical protein